MEVNRSYSPVLQLGTPTHRKVHPGPHKGLVAQLGPGISGF